MIVHTMEQGSEAWIKARIGLPTCSAFHRIFTPHRRKPSRQRDIYLLELVDEHLTGKREEQYENSWTRRGKELEGQARFGYSMETGAAVREVGFITRDDGLVGGSPDGLVGDDTILEIKCAAPHVHPTSNNRHVAQCQGLMYICERQRVHLWRYSDTQDSVLEVMERDTEWIDAFVPELDRFLAELQEAKDEVSAAYRSVG